MKKKRNNRGFTMAELLIVVGIIAVLAGVGFIAVQSYQKSMAQLEADAIAKEIFIAAQNHLTMAESQGYTSETVSYGNPDKVDGVYYFKVPGDSFSDTVLGLMLPFGSIDETIRAGGNYVVRYQANPARVLDVFYGSKTGRYKADPTTGTFDRDALYETSTNHSDNTVIGWYGGAETQESGVQLNAPVITVENAERLTVTVDATKVNVDDTKTETDKSIISATDLSLKLIITNADETAMAAIPISVYTANRAGGSLDDSNARVSKAKDDSGSVISNVYCVVLDDITTTDMHFADINGDATIDKLEKGVLFKPGEDITVYAVAYSNTTLCSIVYSNAVTVNSLFADCHVDNAATNKPLTAYIANFRHLENLDGAVSGVGTGTGTDVITITVAEQIVDLGKLPESEDGASDDETGDNSSGEGSGESGGGTNEEVELTDSGAGTTPAAEKDLSWTGFKQAINPTTPENVQVYIRSEKPQTVQDGTAKGCYYPISPDYALIYNGNGHSITNVSASGTIAAGTGAAGLFGAPTGTPTDSQPWALAVSDLVLYDFDISGSDAGALAGTLPAGSSVTNVLAYHGETAKTVTGTGNAGGLVGSMADGKVEQSAAAMLVSSTGTTAPVSAGGLIGSAANVTVTDSYSGGHTVTGKYKTNALTDYNVTAASGNAGGLIGAASGSTTVAYCYSTCSAGGKVAGGLIGATDGSTVSASSSYAVGKATGTEKTGTFVGEGSLVDREDLDFVYAVDMDSDDLLMIPEIVLGSNPSWKQRADAAPYDYPTLGDKYLYPTVYQLHQLNPPTDGTEYYDTQTQQTLPIHLTKHYGDWADIQLFSDVNLTLINAERLSAKITLPAAQIEDGGKITMLIHGDTSEQDAYLVLKADPPVSEGAPYTLSLSPDSSWPGVEDAELQNQFDKLKKDGTGIGIVTLTGDGGMATETAVIELNLDDITAPGGHFANLFNTFIPGENISVAVKGGVVTQDKLNTIVADTTQNKWKDTKTVDGVSTQYVIAARTNSLFADPAPDENTDTLVAGSDVDNHIAAIANFRHLENLDANISGLGKNIDGKSISITKAGQIKSLVGVPSDTDEKTEDGLNWMGFLSKLSGVPIGEMNEDEPDNGKLIKVYKIDGTTGGHICFIPVNPGAIAYDGQGHSIARVYVNTAENAGLFGTLPSGCTVSNLELIDFNIKGTTTAGALAGVSSATITNVLARNSTSDMDPTVTATGSAGGLVGSMTDGSVVTQSAAALVVNSTGSSAGGLIGTVTGTVTISGSYSGGHTSGGTYDSGHYNVIAASTGKAGGLIGDAGSATVISCYSTCSASGGTAGGLVGNATGTVSNCYAAGLVDGTTKGAFAGSIGSATGCLYFEAVNPGMSAAGNNATADITELDADLKTYKAFVGTAWTDAQPYDAKLARDYGNKYNLKSIGQLDTATTLAASDFVATHYGDWPMPGTQVNNTSSSSVTP